MYLKYNYVPLTIFSCKLCSYVYTRYNYKTTTQIIFTFIQTWTLKQ